MGRVFLSSLSFLLIVLIYGALITGAVFLIKLLIRFVKAVEKIADSLDEYCKNKKSPHDPTLPL